MKLKDLLGVLEDELIIFIFFANDLDHHYYGGKVSEAKTAIGIPNRNVQKIEKTSGFKALNIII